MIAFFAGVENAVVIMAAPTAMSNAVLVREHRRELRSAEHLPLFAGLGAVGAVAGAWALPRIDERLLLLSSALGLWSTLVSLRVRGIERLTWGCPGVNLGTNQSTGDSCLLN